MFQVLEGEYEWTVGGETFVARKGATIFAPREVLHTYRYLGQTLGRLTCLITPRGFERFFEEFSAPSPAQPHEIPPVMRSRANMGWKSRLHLEVSFGIAALNSESRNC